MKNTLMLTFHITSDCNLDCTYCYEKYKKHQVIKDEYYKSLIDNILNIKLGKPSFLEKYLIKDFDNLQIDFIGGEISLYMDKVQGICDYLFEQFKVKGFEDFVENTIILFETNGTTWQNEKVQTFLEKYKKYLLPAITLDGCEACHNKCRKFKNGKGSFDVVNAAVLNHKDLFGKMPASKQTYNKETIQYIKDNIEYFYNLGFRGQINISYDVNSYMTYEEAENYYKEITKAIDWIFENKAEIAPMFLFRNYENKQKKATCGIDGSRIDISADGKLYNCFQFSDTVLNNDILPIGDITNEVLFEDNIALIKDAINNDKLYDYCHDCPIRSECSICIAENKKVTGDLSTKVLNCGEPYVRAKATKYWRDRFIFENDYPYFREEFSLQINNFDENYHYLIKDKK